METQVKGTYSGKLFYPSKTYRIINPRQAILYWLNGVEPLDIYPSRDHETNKPVLVFVFNKEDTKEVYDLWCKYELE